MPMNIMKTGLLLAALTGLFLAVGYLLGAQQGMIIALGLAVAMNLFAFFNADRLMLRLYHAQPVTPENFPDIYDLVANLAARAQLPVPKIYVMDNPQPNAFATGRDPQHAAIAVTTGLIETLDRREIAGVLAHELAHVKNRDTLIMTVTATLAGAIGMVANFAFLFRGGDQRNQPLGGLGMLLAALLAPLVAMLVQFAISRAREFEADRTGAAICGQPDWLASALAKIGRDAPRVLNPEAEHNPATAHLFIVNPLRGGGFENLFSTHPSLDERIRRLQQMSASLDPGPTGLDTAGPWGTDRPAAGPWG